MWQSNRKEELPRLHAERNEATEKVTMLAAYRDQAEHKTGASGAPDQNSLIEAIYAALLRAIDGRHVQRAAALAATLARHRRRRR